MMGTAKKTVVRERTLFMRFVTPAHTSATVFRNHSISLGSTLAAVPSQTSVKHFPLAGSSGPT
jgi:hypothetical protein